MNVSGFKIWAGFLLCVLLMGAGMFSLTCNLQPRLEEAEDGLADGRTLLLDAETEADNVAALLTDASYYTDKRDADLAARWICQRIRSNGGIENLGQLNSPAFKMPADTALAFGGEGFAARVSTDLTNLGMDREWNDGANRGISSVFGSSDAGAEIVVKIEDRSGNASVDGIMVRLRKYTVDTLRSSGGKVAQKDIELVTHTLGYAVTDNDGVARFNVAPGYSYSVLPIQPGYQFGREKGTQQSGSLDGSATFRFNRSVHVLSPLSSSVYRMAKADKLFVVRTPADFMAMLLTGFGIYAVGWLFTFIFIRWRDRRMGVTSDYPLLLLLMALTGIGVLAAYAINDPLTDKANGIVTAWALLAGLVVMLLTSAINYVKYFNGKSRIQFGVVPFDLFDSLIVNSGGRFDSLGKKYGWSLSSGFMYLGLALLLILLLAFFGSGPEGSVARINLGSFQPSEISKYLILIFIAAFFAANAQLIQSFSQKMTRLTIRRQISTVAVIMIVMFLIMLAYLVVLSDMGPALVLLVTFIMIYSMARRDFAMLLVGLLSFIVVLLICQWLGIAVVWGALLGFAGWFAFGWIRSHQIYESAVFINLLIVIFLFGSRILAFVGADSESQRLANRTEMAGEGIWNNTVEGGDQIAQGLWSLASGGLTGMGLGNGNPSLVPAGHTDMIFTSVGEMLGLLGLLIVVVCFVLLIHRSMLIGRRAAHPFVLYLVMGIAIITGVQFVFIVFGSLGLIPLTGVSVPFLSYGRTGLVVTMAMFGIVLSASRIRATETQNLFAAGYDKAIAACVLTFIAGGLVIFAALVKYQVIDKKETLLRPAFITNMAGERVVTYNPRIGLILDELQSGNIYDRNGVLLATSSRDELLKAMPRLEKAGLTKAEILAEAAKRQRRYYPFGPHALFMLGDANRRQVYSYTMDNPVGYLAESRHFDLMRGLDIPSSVVVMKSDKFRRNRFVPKDSAEFRRACYDYGNLYDFLAFGTMDNPMVERHNAMRPERDITLSFDIAMQMALQKNLDKYIASSPLLSRCDNLRASVVVLDAADGDLLCSANYPLPSQDTIAMLQDLRLYADAPAEKLPGHSPITERDLGLTYYTQPGSTAKVMSAIAGFMHSPLAADTCRYLVYGREQIESGTKEPPYGAEKGWVGMQEAIVVSSNNYFMNLVNSARLYPELEKLYMTVGARVNSVHEAGKSATPYFFNSGELESAGPMHNLMNDIAEGSYRIYGNVYMRERREGHTKRGSFKWNIMETGFAWGQGGLLATPLNMARVASIVANGGKLAPTRYLLSVGDSTIARQPQVEVIPDGSALRLASFMQQESDRHRGNGRGLPLNPVSRMGGKTGTPERGDRRAESGKSNDGWYICFINSAKTHSRLAIAVRLERTVIYGAKENGEDLSLGSGYAVAVMADVVLPTLNGLGYGVE